MFDKRRRIFILRTRETCRVIKLMNHTMKLSERKVEAELKSGSKVWCHKEKEIITDAVEKVWFSMRKSGVHLINTSIEKTM